jgi:hypothetical protein
MAGTGALVAAAPAAVAAPATSITSGPANGSFVSSTTATFKWKGGAPYTCKLDSGAATSCTSPKTYSSLAQGKHTFTVTGANGSATRTWTVDTVAPTPAIAAPATLTGRVVIAFGELVTAARNASLGTLTLTGTSTVVPTTTSCWRGSTSVACATATFDTVRLKPSAHLTAGEHYTAKIAAGAVDDRAGNASKAASKAFRGQRSLQENAPGVAVTWQTRSASSAFNGSYLREHRRGAWAAFRFTGTQVTWWTIQGPNQGQADIFIDGAKKATVNNYKSSTSYNIPRVWSGLANKAHRLKIVVLGEKGNKRATGTFIAVDAFTVGTSGTKTDATSANVSTAWRRISSSHLSGHHAIMADLRGEDLTFTFRGTGIAWYTVKAVNQGRAAVYIDGVRKATYDDYATTTTYGVKRLVKGLTDALHTFRLVVLGTHHKGGKGTVVTVDRFLVS